MRTLLLTLMPDSFIPVLIVFTGLALILGIVTRQAAFGFIGLLLLLVVLTPFADALFAALPLWLLLLFGGFFIFTIFRRVLELAFGREAAGHFIGSLLYLFFTCPFRLVGYLIRRRRGI
jgi:hypothetical protein